MLVFEKKPRNNVLYGIGFLIAYVIFSIMLGIILFLAGKISITSWYLVPIITGTITLFGQIFKRYLH